MTFKLFDVDNFSGVTEGFAKGDDGKIRIKKTQDVGHILDLNGAEANSKLDQGWKGDFHKVASIPMVVIDIWREELKAKGAHDCDPLSRNNKRFLIAKINSSEWSKLRTKTGRV